MLKVIVIDASTYRISRPVLLVACYYSPLRYYHFWSKRDDDELNLKTPSFLTISELLGRPRNVGD